ncbi:MAG: argininosuccinate lyase [Bacteroidales bacterium]
MNLWEKGTRPEPSVIGFTSGDDRLTDLRLARWDIVGSMAHACMLSECGLITVRERDELLNALHALFLKEREGNLIIGDGVEDIHSQVEEELTAALGPTGKKIHTGRSRNDQVLTDIRLYTRERIDRLASKVGALFAKFQELSARYAKIIIPGYTHMQPAMPSSFGLWFGAWAECLTDDLPVLSAARELNNRNPLGSAAGYGSTLPINRRLTTNLLEFNDLLYNSAYASLNRGKAELATAAALASVAQTLGRFSTDACLFMTAEFHFIDIPDAYVTGSSIMPQKRNPDVFELIRGRTNLIQTLPGQVSAIVSNLPSGYNRDLQLMKQLVFGGFDSLESCIEMTILMISNITVRKDITKDLKYGSIYSTEEVNRLVRKGMPFRDAYRKIAGQAGVSEYSQPDLTEYTHEGSMGNLCSNAIKKLFKKRLKGFNSASPDELEEKILKMTLTE